MEIIEFEHPIARDFVTRLRNKYFPPSRFRAYSQRIGYLLAVEATRNLATSPARVETPLEETLGEVLADSPVIIPVLRAGLGLLDPFMSVLPDSPVAFVGLRQNGESSEAELLYQSTPNITGSTVILLDPMVASGETAEKVLELLYRQGVEHVILVSILAAPEGVARLKKYDELTVITAMVDRELDQDWFIRPGLGDYADRLFRGGELIHPSRHRGLFVAGAGKDAGKTTLSLGLVSSFRQHLPGGVSFLKPLGQKTTVVDGRSVGEDSWFLNEALDLDFPLERTAPFITGRGAAEEFLVSGEPRDILKRIRKAYRELSAETDLVVVEGTGHPGVGSVFGLSNADVAAALDIPVILVLDGGIGSTIDRFTLCSSIFEQAGIRISGVVVNRVLPSRMDKVRKLLDGWFSQAGIRVLGYVPWLQSISRPSLGSLSRILKAECIGSSAGPEYPVSGFITSFGNRNETLREISENPDSAVVLSAGRTDIIDSLIARRTAGGNSAGPGALILCGEGETDSSIVAACEKLSLPLFRTDTPAGKASSVLSGRTFKVEPGEAGKIEETVKLIESTVNMDTIMDILALPAAGQPVRHRRLLTRMLEKPAGFFRKVLGRKGRSSS